MSNNPDILQIVELIVKNLSGGSASIEIIYQDEITIYQVKSPMKDLGALIGKKGNVAQSIKNILMAFSGKERHSYRVEFIHVNER